MLFPFLESTTGSVLESAFPLHRPLHKVLHTVCAASCCAVDASQPEGLKVSWHLCGGSGMDL